MSLIAVPNTFTAGAVIVASEHNSNFSTIYNDYNGSILNANISASAAIVDTKLATISTAGKVNISALTVASQATGDLICAASASTWQRVAVGTSSQVLIGGTTPSFGTAPVAAGTIIQCLNGQSASVVTINSVLAQDNSIPLDAETVQICAVTITPGNASNKLRIRGSVTGSASSAATVLGLCIFNGTTCVSANWNQCFSTSAEDADVELFIAAGGTSAITFNLKAGVSGNNYYVNGDGSGTRIGGGVCFANITAEEIKV